jgi:cob(I)alamin adenosyltransferase
VRLDRIVTRTGDEGTTAIAGGVRLAKNAPRIEAIGALDEANAALGLLRADLPADGAEAALVLALQHDLFDLGAALARPHGEGPLGPAHLHRLEAEIAALRESLAPLNSFVLPGANRTEALAHLARTQIRRAERALVALGHNEPLPPVALPYLNRLSDLLFLLGRRLAGGAEVLWRPGGGSGGAEGSPSSV